MYSLHRSQKHVPLQGLATTLKGKAQSSTSRVTCDQEREGGRDLLEQSLCRLCQQALERKLWTEVPGLCRGMVTAVSIAQKDLDRTDHLFFSRTRRARRRSNPRRCLMRSPVLRRPPHSWQTCKTTMTPRARAQREARSNPARRRQARSRAPRAEVRVGGLF